MTSQRRMTFFFDAAACSGCKACQVACKDRHGLEVGRLWRRVSEIAGGGWEQEGNAWRNTVFAYHLSMACNHCQRPICLEGCPTRAITQRADGVVLIDDGACMGCGYCSWVCPYSAPQYDTERGVMSKCSFCAEDLDAGLEPACVAACPVRALDAGDGDELAARHGAATGAEALTPMPDADLTEPALRLTPHADAGRSAEPDVELTPRPPRGLREWSLVLFTVLTQTAAGLALFGGGLRWWLGGREEPGSLDHVVLPVILGLLAIAMFFSLLHLGRKRNSVRSLLNLRSSWLSREVALALSLLLVAIAACWPGVSTWVAWLTVPLALALLTGMAEVYLQRTVPVWNTWRTPVSFFGTALLMGGMTVNVIVWTAGAQEGGLMVLVSSWVALGAVLWDQLNRRRRYYARYERIGV